MEMCPIVKPEQTRIFIVSGSQDDGGNVPMKQRSQTPTGSIPLLSGPPPPRSSPRTTLPAKVLLSFMLIIGRIQAGFWKT